MMAEKLLGEAARPRRAASSFRHLDREMDEAVAEIEGADRKALLDRWEEYFGRAAPSHLREELLRRALAHEAQMQLAGAAERAVRRRLERLARAGQGPRVRRNIKIYPGIRFVREWGGEVHQVTALPKGFDYRGSTYKSLSEIARRITGTRWSGPLFFGLKDEKDGR